MNFFIKIVAILILGYLGQLYLPFWILACAAILASLMIRTSHVQAFLAGLVAGFLLWAVTAYFIDANTDAIITQRVAAIFSISNIFLIAVTGFIGGIVAALGSLTGSLFMGLFTRKRSTGPYRA